MKKNILITGARAPSSLELSRILSKENNVFAADSLRFPMSRFSFSINRFFHLSKPVLNINKYKEELIKIIKENDIDMIIPTCEEAFFISKIKNNLSQYCYVFVDDIEKMKLIHSKIDVFSMINDKFINKPVTKVIDIKDNKDIDENSLIKIEYSRFGNGVFSESDSAPLIEPHNRYLIQEKIKGKEYSTYTIAKEGTVIETVTYHSIHRIKNSAGVCFEPVEHSRIDNFIYDFIKNNNYTGQIGFDIIENENGIYLIDANPRSTSGIHFFSGKLDLFDINKSNIIKSKKYKGLLLPTLLLSEGSFLKKISVLKNIFKYNEVVFKIKDPLPSLCQFILMGELIYIKIKYKKNILEASTFDIEWDGDDFE